MSRPFLFSLRSTPHQDAALAELGGTIAGVGIMAVGVIRVAELELDEPARLLGFAVSIMVGLALVGIGQLGGIRAQLTASPRAQAPSDATG